MMKKIFAILLLSFGIAGNAFAGGRRCSCAHDYREVSTNDEAFNQNRICGPWTVGQQAYGQRANKKFCQVTDIGNAGCDGRCRIYKYEWVNTAGSCVPGKTAQDPTLNFMVYPYSSGAWFACWQPICKDTKYFFKGSLKNAQYGIYDKRAVDYGLCEPCRLTFVEVNSSDETELSYVKIVPDPNNKQTACMAGAKDDSTCGSYKKNDMFKPDDGCAKRGCRCTTGKPIEYPGSDGDYYVKCG